MAEINIGSLSGGGGGGENTWLKPEMEGGNNVEITSNQYLRFYKNPATGAYLELNMSGSLPTARMIDANGNITTIDGNSLDFNSAFDPSNPALSSYLPAEIRIKTFEGGDPAGLYFVCLDLNHNLAATLNLIRGTYGGTTGSSDPVEDGMLLGELAFWGQDNAGIITPGQFNNINKPSRISVYATEDYTLAARGSEMVIYNTEAGTTTQRGNFRFLGTGQNRMELYGTGNFEDNNPAYFAGVDANGNIIEIDPAAVGPAIGATWLKPEMEGGNDVDIDSPQRLSIGDSAASSFIQQNGVLQGKAINTAVNGGLKSGNGVIIYEDGANFSPTNGLNIIVSKPLLSIVQPVSGGLNDLWPFGIIDNTNGRVAFVIGSGNSLFTKHTTTGNSYRNDNVLLGYGGYGTRIQAFNEFFGMYTRNSDQVAFGRITNYTTATSNAAPLMVMDRTNNRIGILTTVLTQPLDVNGNVRLRAAIYDNSNLPGSAGQVPISTGSGFNWGTIPSAVNVYNTSDALTGNRQISGDGFSLNIFNTSTFQIEDVTNVMNLEVTPTDVSFFDGAFNFSAADLPFNNQIIKMDSGNITGSNVMSETGTAITFAAPLYEIDGAESLPSYSNTGDTDTGIFFPAADAVGISTGATEKVRVDALGLRLMTSFTPTGTADATGATGAVSWDDDYIYVKTSAGWKRSALSTF